MYRRCDGKRGECAANIILEEIEKVIDILITGQKTETDTNLQIGIAASLTNLGMIVEKVGESLIAMQKVEGQSDSLCGRN